MPRYITLGSYTNEGAGALVDGDSALCFDIRKNCPGGPLGVPS